MVHHLGDNWRSLGGGSNRWHQGGVDLVNFVSGILPAEQNTGNDVSQESLFVVHCHFPASGRVVAAACEKLARKCSLTGAESRSEERQGCLCGAAWDVALLSALVDASLCRVLIRR